MADHPGARDGTGYGPGARLVLRVARHSAPLLFVFLWSTGFIGAKYGLPYAEPLTFVSLRFGIVFCIVSGWAVLVNARLPSPRLAAHTALSGVLLHAGFMGTTFVAIAQGVEAGTAALIAALQPVVSALLAKPLLGEDTTGRQWLGLCLGVLGVLLVVSDKLSRGVGTPLGFLLCLIALASLSFGTIWQKKHGSSVPLVSSYVIQFGAAAMVTLPLAITFENMYIDWTREFLLVLSWLVVCISIGAIALLYAMLRAGAAARVSTLFFLTL